MVPFETEEALLGTLKDPSPTPMITKALGNLEPEEEVVASSKAEREEEGSSTVTT